jgi:hypothetical protein
VRVLEVEARAVLEHVVADVENEEDGIRRVARPPAGERPELVVGRVAGDPRVQHLDPEPILETRRERLLEVDLDRLHERIAEDEDAASSGGALVRARAIALPEGVDDDGPVQRVRARPTHRDVGALAGHERPPDDAVGAPERRLAAAAAAAAADEEERLGQHERHRAAEEEEAEMPEPPAGAMCGASGDHAR